ncbi:MAG: RHS domain-containing protein [Myxococcales bacterium]|nr:RHS domain-containing protein [Myxococcales bacterium]
MTNALGGVTRWRRDEAGELLAVENAAGDVVSMTRDSRGNILTLVNQVGGVTSFRYDSRGLVESVVEPNGCGTRFKHDAHGNTIEVIEPNGGIWKASYDFYGNRTSLTNPLGEVMRYEHSLGGLLTRYVAPDGSTTSYSYDAAGHLTRATDGDGTSVGLEWGGYNARHQVNKPDGTSIRYRFDRDGRLREIRDEVGNVHTREYQPGGFLQAEKTFDGRVLRYKHDACGQLVEVINGALEKTKFEYDPLGQLIERTYSDGLSETFTYNAVGSLVRAASGGVVTEFERDPRGLCVAETQLVDGVPHTVRRSFDVAGQLMGRSTSLNHSLDIQRDTAGMRARDLLDGSLEVDYTRDLLGRAVGKSLGAGGFMEDAFDNRNRLTERRVRAVGASSIAVGDGEPAWVGARRSTAGIEKAYRFSSQGDLLDAWTLAEGSVTYEYDTLGQLLERIPERGDRESFRFDPTGNIHEAGPNAVPRKYASKRLVERGGVEYVWDADGRLTEKRRPSPDGSTQRWLYNWSSKGTLTSVIRPDKTRIEFAYDAFFRRVAKRVVPASKQDRASAVKTRFVWDEASLVHEIRSTHDVVSERTYCFDGAVPKAQRDVTIKNGVREEGPWYHYVNDLAGTPEELVDARGVIVAKLKRSTWGKGTTQPATAASSNIRFQGQYEDEETGLSYNRHRYYDAETGRYISADPLGLAGGLNPFAYVPNPNGYVDPLGLTTSDVTEDLAEAMANDPVNRRPIRTEHQAHHIVPREHERGDADDARRLLRDNNISLDDPENGARLLGRHQSNIDAGGHSRGCAGYHGTRSDGTGSVHSASAYDTVNRRLQAAATRSGRPNGSPEREAAIRAELRVIGGEMERGTWMTDEDRANAAR